MSLSLPGKTTLHTQQDQSSLPIAHRGVVIKSTDAGETWQTVYTGSNIQKLKFVNSNKGFIAGYNNTFKKTEDGGATWADINIGVGVYVYKTLEFWDENNGIVSFLSENDGQMIYRTIDGGDTWTAATTLPTRTLENLTYADAKTLYGVGNASSVFRSTDGGNNWSLMTQTPGETYNLNINFRDANTGIYAGEEGDLYTTTDAGQTWTQKLYTGWHFFYGLLYKGNQILAAGTDEDVYLSNDNGTTWNVVFNADGDSALYDIELFANNSGLICGSQGKILKFENVVLQANDIARKQDIIFYPNPVNDILNLSSEKNISSVSIYSTDGKIMFDGVYKDNAIKLDLSKLKAGVYMVKANLNDGSQKNLKVIKK